VTRTKKLTLLTALYLAQGLPYGFFTQALPVLLRTANLSLPQIGLANLLTLPWALKFIWAPSVDRFHFPKMGLRKSWLLPLQALSIALYSALGFITLGAGELSVVLAAFLFTNLLAASQDVATDGLAVDILVPEERGWANGIQVAGYRIGMIIGGGALLAIYPTVGWSGVMFSMAGFAALCTIPVLTYSEPLFPDKPRSTHSQARSAKPVAALKEMVHFYLAPGALLWMLVLLLYKFGHASATGMLRPWLVDQGYSIQDIAWILGTGGFVAGFLGAMGGGWLAAKYSRPKLLIVLGVLQMLAVASYLWPVMTEHAAYKVLISASLDHFTSGLATTTLFTLMMDACTKERAASDYTAQACTVVVSQGLASAIGGFSAEHLGYSIHFRLCSEPWP
jgi:MFS transporter, PAT family, beta-lactamase induction signal transducer AmpG